MRTNASMASAMGGAQSDAGVVPAVGGEFDGVAVDVDTAARCGNGAGGFDGDIDADVLSGADAAEDAAGVVGQEALRGQFVAVFAAALDNAAEACADFHAFDGVDAHHRVGNFGIEAVENGFTQTDGDVGRFDMQFRADGIQGFAHAVHIVFQLGDLAMVGGEKRILGNVLAAFNRISFSPTWVT